MDAITLRRIIHQNPELSFEEHLTAQTIADALTQIGVTHRPIAQTGVMATTKGDGESANCVVLRADIDALPIEEQTGVEFSSCKEGIMHACGHDMHTAILFGALKKLAENPNFNGTIIAIFQPGEELLPGGASKVLSENPFDGYTIKGIVTQHVEPELEVGEVGFKEGMYMAACDELRFCVTGKGGHAALREKIDDTVGAAAQITTSLLSLNQEAVVLSIGKISAQGATNIIPDEVKMEGTLRTFDETKRANLHKDISQKISEVDKAFGTKTTVEITNGYPSVYNNEELTQFARQRASLQGLKVVDLKLRPTAEDFGYYSQKYPSVLYRLGVGTKSGKLHTPTFNPDERAIEVGANLMYDIAKELLK